MNQSALNLIAATLLLLMYSTDAKMNIITSTPDVSVGAEVLLYCKAGGEGDITWRKDGTEIEDNDEFKVEVADETSSKLEIKTAKMEHAGKYTCHCEFNNGHDDHTEIQLFVYDGPSFGQTITYHEFLEGTQGVVPCLVTGTPAVDVQWLRDKQAVSSNVGSRVRQGTNNTLLIESVRRADAGIYLCYAQIRGRPINQQLSVSVVVNAPPTVSLKEKEKKVLAGPESNISLLCLVDGHPKPSITWTIPTTIDPSRHQFNSDRSELTIRSVVRTDYGEYVCTATNKIAGINATIMLHVFEAPEVFVSAEQLHISAWERVSVSCNVSGYPHPDQHWLNKHNGQKLSSTSGRVHVDDGTLVIEEVVPSDGGLYSCMAVSAHGNASRDVAIYTQPGPPHYVSVTPGPISIHFSLKESPINGGTPITSFVLQWRKSEAEKWKEVTVPVSGPLDITDLKQYTLYSVRLAAMNAVGVGQFSDTNSVRTLGRREPDSPVVSIDKMNIERNSVSVPVQQIDDGGTPLKHFNIRYKVDKDGDQWKEVQMSADIDSISLEGLSFGSDYQLEVTGVNANGSSVPVAFNFSIGEQPVSSRMTKGSVVAIVMVIFIVVFLVVDVTCCYRNRCGLLMSIAVKLFGQKVPGLRMLGAGEGNTNGEVKLKGIATPRGSMQGVQSGNLTEVTCDKVSLTKHEKTQPDLHNITA